MSARSRILFEAQLRLAAWLQPWQLGRRGLETLLAATTPDPALTPYAGMDSREIVVAVRGVLARPWLMRDRRCLRSALLAFRFLRLAGHPAIMHFSVAPPGRGDRPLRAHSWVTLDGICLLDPPEPTMVALFAWDGALHPATADAP